MRLIFLALLIVGGSAAPGPAQAQTATQYQFCIQGIDNPGWSGCSFKSFQECQAAASGTEAECLSNPWYRAGDRGAPAPGGSQPVPVQPVQPNNR
jgi:hypothetical protein